MPLSTEFNLQKTNDAVEFEDMVCDVCTIKFGLVFQKYGRSGQKQYGIDIHSVGQKELICIQCKNYAITQKDIDNIIDEAIVVLKSNKKAKKLQKNVDK